MIKEPEKIDSQKGLSNIYFEALPTIPFKNQIKKDNIV